MNLMKLQPWLALVVILFGAKLEVSKPAHAGESFTHVAIVTIEDLAGDVKTRLYRTRSEDCPRQLRVIIDQFEAAPEVVRVVSANCDPVGNLTGFFRGEQMGVPYIQAGARDVLILRGASPAACKGLAAYWASQNIQGAKCVLP